MLLRKRVKDAVMCVFPSDHYIKKEDEFLKILDKAIKLAEKTDSLITIGIKPTFPCTGYGYIHMGSEKEKNVYEVKEFVKSPIFKKQKSIWLVEIIYGIVGCLSGKFQLYLIT